MSFNPNIPQAGDNPTNSQSQFLANFGQLNTQIGINHVSLTAGGNNGQHTKIFFPDVLSADPNLVAPQSSLYPKQGLDSTNELFFQNGALAANVAQLTNLHITTSGTNYGFKSPWGLIFNMGQATGVGNTGTVTFAVPYSSSTFYTALLTQKSGLQGNSMAVTAITNTTLTFSTLLTNITVYYLVIGK